MKLPENSSNQVLFKQSNFIHSSSVCEKWQKTENVKVESVCTMTVLTGFQAVRGDILKIIHFLWILNIAWSQSSRPLSHWHYNQLVMHSVRPLQMYQQEIGDATIHVLHWMVSSSSCLNLMALLMSASYKHTKGFCKPDLTKINNLFTLGLQFMSMTRNTDFLWFLTHLSTTFGHPGSPKEELVGGAGSNASGPDHLMR